MLQLNYVNGVYYKGLMLLDNKRIVYDCLQVEHAVICGVDLSIYLMELCSDLIERNFAISPVLVLFKRLVLTQMDKDQDSFHGFNYMVVFLAHMLVTVEYEHEQLLLLNLSSIFLEWKRKSGMHLSSI